MLNSHKEVLVLIKIIGDQKWIAEDWRGKTEWITATEVVTQLGEQLDFTHQAHIHPQTIIGGRGGTTIHNLNKKVLFQIFVQDYTDIIDLEGI